MMDNNRIKSSVEMLVNELVKKSKPGPDEEAVIRVGAALLTNLLQNINDVAHHLGELQEIQRSKR